jgi:hypothetical protein
VVMQAYQLLATFRLVPWIDVDSSGFAHVCYRRGIKIVENTIQEFRLHSSMCLIVFGLLMLLTRRSRT